MSADIFRTSTLHLSARVCAGGEGPIAKRWEGEVGLLVPSIQPSSLMEAPPHLPVASQRVPSSPLLRGGEDVRGRWSALGAPRFPLPAEEFVCGCSDGGLISS